MFYRQFYTQIKKTLLEYCQYFKQNFKRALFMPHYVVGHKIPDSDSICSAIALSYLKTTLGEETVPARLGGNSALKPYLFLINLALINRY